MKHSLRLVHTQSAPTPPKNDHKPISLQNFQNTPLMPREKLLHKGAKALTDAELLAIFLRTGIKGLPVVALAEQILQQWGLRGLFRLSTDELHKVKGLGLAKYAQLNAVMELSRRFLLADVPVGEPISSSTTIADFLIAQIGAEQDEHFAAAFLDTKHHLIEFEVLFTGTINEATVYPRTLVKKAIQHNCAAMILCHNHPSGNLTPSQHDIHLTKKVQEILNIINIRLLDHIIVSKTETLSLAEQCYF